MSGIPELEPPCHSCKLSSTKSAVNRQGYSATPLCHPICGGTSPGWRCAPILTRAVRMRPYNSHNVVKICGLWGCIVEAGQPSVELYEATRLAHGRTTYATHTETSGYRRRSLMPGLWDGAPGRGAR